MNHAQQLIDVLVGWIVPVDGEGHAAAVFHVNPKCVGGTKEEPQLIVDIIPGAQFEGQFIPLPGWGNSTAKRYRVRRKARGTWGALCREDVEVIPQGTVEYNKPAIRRKDKRHWDDLAQQRIESEKQQAAAEAMLAEIEAGRPHSPRDLKKHPIKIRIRDAERERLDFPVDINRNT